MNKLLVYFSALGRRLLDLRDSPHAIAGGAAIGMFMGFSPLFGLKTLLCLLLAWVLRCNPIAAVITVSLHDVVTPFWPFLLRMEYDIGYWILSHPHALPPKWDAHHFHPGEILRWTTFFRDGLPLLVGSFFLSAPSAAVAYAAMLAFLKRRAARHAAKETPS